MKVPSLQDAIHQLEMGSGFRFLRVTLAVLALVMLLVGYNWRSFRNMGTQEAMDSAQVARNLAAGEGFTTKFIRPFSIYLVKQRNESKRGVAPVGVFADYAQLKGAHPDLANPPVYPVVLAGLMKVMPFKPKIETTKPFWNRDGRFWRYQPDFVIAVFNELIFIGIVVLTFFLTRRLFDVNVAWLAALLLLGCELLWRFSVSGLSTMLLMLFFMGLTWCLVLLEAEAREPKRTVGYLFLLAAAIGLLVGLGALTRYAFGWIILPVLGFVFLFAGPRRIELGLLTLGVFLVVLAPWLFRNYNVSGTLFGTNSYAILEGSSIFSDNKLGRSLNPDFSRIGLMPFIYKLLSNTRAILANDLPKLGGSWVAPFFLVGLLLGFRNPAIRRLRYFIVSVLLLFIVVQALGRTQLTEDSPELNSENLLVLTVPLVLVFGVSLFYLLLDQINLPVKELRYVIIGAFGVVACLPLIFTFLPPKTIPVVYPPYYPPAIQQTASWMKEKELMMSDIPWAVAWYGNRQCIWLTLNAQSEFFAVNDLLKPVLALYLTPQTMDSRFLSQWVRAGEHSWGSFILESMLRREIPATFPLRKAPAGFLPEQLFLADTTRWPTESTTPVAPASEEDAAKSKAATAK